MKCIKCGCPTRVVDTKRMGSPRPRSSIFETGEVDRYTVHRVRRCRCCGHKFQTTEKPSYTVMRKSKMTEILQLVAPALVGCRVHSRTSETSFIVDRIDASGVHSDLDQDGAGLWLEHGNYYLPNSASACASGIARDESAERYADFDDVCETEKYLFMSGSFDE